MMSYSPVCLQLDNTSALYYEPKSWFQATVHEPVKGPTNRNMGVVGKGPSEGGTIGNSLPQTRIYEDPSQKRNLLLAILGNALILNSHHMLLRRLREKCTAILPQRRAT